VLGACSDSSAVADDASAGADDSDASTGEYDTSDPSGDTSGEGPASPTDDSATDTNATAPGDTGSGETSEDGVDEKCLLQCGDGGECAFDENGEQFCECYDGYASNGATCVACVAPPAGIDLTMSEVELRITIDGSSPPMSALEYGEIRLRNRATGDVVALGDTRTPVLATSVVAGHYDVYYSRTAGSAVVPANRNARIGAIDASTDVESTIEIPTVVIFGAFEFDGVAAPDVDYESGRVWLRHPDSGDEVLLGTTSDSTYSVRVIPDLYDLRYEGIAGSAVAPAGTGTFGELVAQTSEVATDVDVPTVALNGTFNFDGALAPDSDLENGRITLRSAETEILLGETRTGEYSVRVLPGSYDVVYEGLVGSAVAPANKRATVRELEFGKADGDQTVDIDIRTVELSGSLLFNNEAAPADPSDDGFVMLRHPSGDEVLLGMTSSLTYSRRVIEGPYDVYYAQDTSSQNAPRNTNARIRELVAQAGAVGDIDIQRVDVSGTITLAGATPPDSDYQDGHLYLRDLGTGDSVLLGNTRAGGYAAPAVPGDYEIVYVADDAAGPLPINTGAVIGDVTVAAGGPVDLSIDVPTLALGGTVTVNGEAAPMDALDIGNIYLVDAHTQDQLWLGNTFQGVYQQTLTPGNYLVYYRVAASQGGVPANENANLGCWQLN
jgi:hypothetical protein